jgi:hypothetical protein
MKDKTISEAELMVDKIYNLMEDEWNPLDGSHKAGLISDSNMDMAIKIAELLKAGQTQALDWVEKEVEQMDSCYVLNGSITKHKAGHLIDKDDLLSELIKQHSKNNQ